jgi:hypothetical protein
LKRKRSKIKIKYKSKLNRFGKKIKIERTVNQNGQEKESSQEEEKSCKEEKKIVFSDVFERLA